MSRCGWRPDTITSVQFVKAGRAPALTAARPADTCAVVSGGNGLRCRPLALAPQASASFEFDTAAEYPDGANGTVLVRGGAGDQAVGQALASGPGTSGTTSGEPAFTGVAATRGGLRISVAVPSAGRLLAVAQARVGRRRLTLVTRAVNVAQAGTVSVVLRPTRAARRALRRRRSVRASIRVSFTPEGGAPTTITRAATFRLR